MMIKIHLNTTPSWIRGTAGYVLNIKYDKETGEIKENTKQLLALDEERIRE